MRLETLQIDRQLHGTQVCASVMSTFAHGILTTHAATQPTTFSNQAFSAADVQRTGVAPALRVRTTCQWCWQDRIGRTLHERALMGVCMRAGHTRKG